MAAPPEHSIRSRTRRHPVLALTLACLIVLVLAQALIGALSLAALNRLLAQTTADRLEATARSVSAEIQNGMRLGKPLAQYFGLQEVINKSATETAPPDIRVALHDGTILAQRDIALAYTFEDTQPLFDTLRQDRSALVTTSADLTQAPTRMSSGAVMMARGDSLTVAVPLLASKRELAGAVLVTVDRYGQAWLTLISKNLSMLAITTTTIGLMLAAALKYGVSPDNLTRGSRARFVLPLVAIVLAQGIYAAYTISTFRTVWTQVAQQNAATLAEGLQRDINRILGFGLDIGQLRGTESPFSRLQAIFPAMGEIALIDHQDRTLSRTRLPDMPPEQADDMADFTLPLAANGNGPPAGYLAISLNKGLIDEGVRSRIIDALTVSAVALVTAMEMLLLLSLLQGRDQPGTPAPLLGRGQPANPAALIGQSQTETPAPSPVQAVGQGGADVALVGRLARPVMFTFLFAWALPLGFLPVYARALPADLPGLPPHLLMALPISVEMFCGLVTALLAGRLTDRKGWQTPVLAGLFIAALGMISCAWASTLSGFAASRGLVGLGYGLTWMGLQGFVVTYSAPQARGRNMTGVIAGLFAGHLSGAAVGAMLAEQTGYHSVFVVGAMMLTLPLIGVLVLMRPYMQAPASRVKLSLQPRALKDTLALLSTRDFGLLLIGSIVPFSIAQVGLISFALPLYLEAQGAAASSVGRILMIYGLCVIYVGPLMGRFADRSPHKKKWIVAAGIIGSAGLFALYGNGGVMAAAVAVFLLALASCLSGASQSPYMLGLPHVQNYGAAAATSVMRAADKLGQMAGPLIVGTMFGLMGMGAGLAVTGMIYLSATLAFWIFAPGSQRAQTNQ